jgi:hypothetical protein
LIEPVTRQNAGSFEKSGGGPNAGASDLNAPAATLWTPAIVVFGKASEASCSHDFGVAAEAVCVAELFAGSLRPHAPSKAKVASTSAVEE